MRFATLGATNRSFVREVNNSLRFENGSSDYLNRTPSSNGSATTATFSGWVKGGTIGQNTFIFGGGTSGNDFQVWINTNDQLALIGRKSSSANTFLISTQFLRDVSAWFHIVAVFDTTNATSGDRARLYVNGERITDFSTETLPSQNETNFFNNTSYANYIGSQFGSSYSDLYLAEAVWIDGQALDPTSFGETDTDTGIWKPIDVSSLTFGTNGFYLPFENSGALGQDDSGNGNNFTVNNLTSIDQTTDTPTNNFATLNPLAVPTSNAPTFADGNCKTSTNDGALFGGVSTFAVTQGKWYVEAKRISQDSGSADDGFRIGFGVTNNTDWNTSPVSSANSGHYYMIGTGTVYNGSTDLGDQAGDSNISDNGVVQIALDLDNNQISWGFNGGWMDGANGWTNSTPSTWISITDPASTEAGYFFLSTDGSTIRGYTASWNFGNPPFTISSGNSDANGYGNFEYAVPSGYYALNSKNLAEFG